MQRIVTKGERLSKIRRQLKAANKRFKKLTRKEQRIAIAEDVIAQVKAKKFVAASTYFEIGNKPEFEGDTYPGEVAGIDNAVEAELSTGECIAQVGCMVCGIGSLFASAVMKHDKQTFDNNVNRDVETDYLNRWFDDAQLDLIEAYYERQDYRMVGFGYEDSPIYNEYDDNRRLIMIMENIVSNGGVFDQECGAHEIGDDQ